MKSLPAREICCGGAGALQSGKFGPKMRLESGKICKTILRRGRKFGPMANFSGTRKYFRIQLYRYWSKKIIVTATFVQFQFDTGV